MTPQTEWLRLCAALIDQPVIPLSDEEMREFKRSVAQADRDATWRLHNPPQRDLFHRG